MSASITITENAILAQLRAMIIALTGYAPENVIRGRANSAPMPTGPFVVVQSLGRMAWRTNIEKWDAPNNAIDLDAGLQVAFQVDAYGPSAADVATMMAVATRSTWSQQYVSAMYASDPKQLTFINAEEQFEERWSFDAVLAYNPTVAVPQDYFTAVDIGLEPVDVYFPPGG
jgi:hypothetical protein